MTSRAQRPRRPLVRTVVAYGVLACIWLLPPLLLWPATLLAGGHPSLNLLWAVAAADGFFSGQGAGQPWRWLGSPGVARPTWFWVTLVAELGLGAGVPWAVLSQLTGVGRAPGASRWARRWDLRRAGLLVRGAKPLRLVLGRAGRRLVASRAGVSVLVFGPTGSGKTAGVCVPHILEWDGPVVAISVKNDLVMRTAGLRQRMGRTDVYDPTGITGLGTCTWSPIDGCQDWDRAMRVGQWLVQGRGGYATSDPEWAHWEDASIRLVTCALYAGASLGRPITDALSWLDDGTGQKLGMALTVLGDRDPRALQWYHSVQERPDRERGSCYSTSQKTLRPYIERAVAASAKDCSFDPRQFLSSGTGTLYIVAPQSEQERLSGIFTSLVMTIMTEATDIAQANRTGRLSRPLLVVLDECANTAPIRELPQYLSTVRSMGITVVAIFQDLSQCEVRYKELAGSIVNNARAVLFLSGGKDRKTLELMRDLAGRRWQRRYTQDNRGGEQVTLDKDELLPVDAGRQLRPGQAMLLYEHLPPILLGMRSCYRDRDLLARTRRHAYYPGVTEVTYERGTMPQAQVAPVGGGRTR